MAPKVATQKMLEKQKVKEANQRARNEKVLAKALEKYEKSGLQTDLQYITMSLQDTPAWVSPLARLMRQGALTTLLRMGSGGSSADAAAQGVRWQGKARHLLSLPTDVLWETLECTGVQLPEDQREDRDLVQSCCQAQFWIVRGTPLPQHRDIRLVQTLKSLAKARVEDLGFAYFKDKTELAEPMWCEHVAMGPMGKRRGGWSCGTSTAAG